MSKPFNPYDPKVVYEREKKELQETIEHNKRETERLKKEYNDMFRVMSNRCFALSQGTLCIFCGYKNDCKRYNDAVKEDGIDG